MSSNDPSSLALQVLPTIAVAAVTLTVLSYLSNRKSKIAGDVVEPPRVFSLIPHVGSAIEMGNHGIRAFVQKYTDKYKTPIFSATIMGNTCHFIGDPTNCSTFIYKPQKGFDRLTLQHDFLNLAMGCEMTNVSQAHANKEWIKYSDETLRTHILHTQSVDQTVVQAQTILAELLSALEPGEYDLYDLVQSNLFRASVEPFISKNLSTPELLAPFTDFDHGVPMVMAKAPMGTTKFFEARDRLLTELKKKDFLETASPFMKARQKLCDEYGTSPDNMARMNLALMWASVGNSGPAIFWTLLFVLSNKEAHEAIRNEVDAVAEKSADGEACCFSMQELDQMPTIESAFSEALRLRAQPVTARNIAEDVIFDPKIPGQPKYLLKKGTRLLGHQGVVYHDEEIFPKPAEYQYDRFLPKDGKPPVFTKNDKVLVNPLKTFGGGKNLCPGRKFITFEAKAYLAMLFRKFDMTLVDDEMPGSNHKTGGIGIIQPDREVKVKFSIRRSDMDVI